MTDDGTAYRALDEVSRSFLPIRISEPGSGKSPSHVTEFIDAVLKVKVEHPFVAIAPIFYNMRNWVGSERDTDRSEPLQFASRITDIQKRLSWQVAFTRARGVAQGRPVRGFTSTVVDEVNKRSDIRRVLVIIRTGSQPTSFKHGQDLCLTVSVPKSVRDQFIGPIEAPTLPILGMERCNAEEPWKGQEDVKVTKYPDLANCESTIVRRSDDRPVEKALVDLIVPHANEHSLYIDHKHSLIYVFSNVVQVGDNQLGCGGLFVVVNNKALEDPDLTWLHQAKSLSDKLANRIIHQAQLVEVEHHALNSAITQTAARNYAHHIGAHVKMRTTPQEIKKRIGDLYPDLKGLI